MNILLIFIIAVVIGMALVVGTLLWVTDKAGHSAITSYFKAAEYIIEHHQPPPKWMEKASTNREDILKRMDDLILFFEHSTFFEDENARSVLLEKLNQERADWEENLHL